MEYEDFRGVATLGLESFMLLPKFNHCCSLSYEEFLLRMGFWNTEPYVEMLKKVVEEWVEKGWIKEFGEKEEDYIYMFITDKFYEDFGYTNERPFKADDWMYRNMRPLNLGHFLKEGE